MTEYELLDVINSSQQTMAALNFGIVSQQGAFVAVVYFVGRKLRKFHLSLLILAYTLFLIGPTTGHFTALLRFWSATDQLRELQGLEPVGGTAPSLFALLVLVFTYMLTLIYAWTVIRPEKGHK